MNREFEAKIKKIEQELIDLKTACEYTSVKSASYTSTFKASIGMYRITFESNENVMSIVNCCDDNGVWGSGYVYGRTPSGNTQLVEVGYSPIITEGSPTEYVPFVVISNTPVLSIERV